MSVKNRNSVVTDGLVFYVDAGNEDSYPGSGTTWTDLIGGVDGTLTNGPNYDSGNGGVVDFDGTNDFINFSNSGFVPLEDYSDFTINTWMKAPSSQSNWVAVFCYADSTNNYLTLQRRSNSSEIVLYHAGVSSPNNLGNIYSSIFSGGWLNITLTFASGSVTLYSNGSQFVSTSGVSLGTPSNHFFRIFSERTTLTTEGSFSNLSIYNRALSSTEILQNYNALKSRFV